MKSLLLLQTIAIVAGSTLGLTSCSETGAVEEKVSLPKKLDSYSLRGLNFAYYLIPAGLEEKALIDLARKIHQSEPDTHLILVDDEAGVGKYIEFAKGSSAGREGIEFPKQWAKQHVVANLQLYLSGKWYLCEGYGYTQIGEVK